MKRGVKSEISKVRNFASQKFRLTPESTLAGFCVFLSDLESGATFQFWQ